MNANVTNICNSSFFHLHNIRRIRKYLSTEPAKLLVHAFVTSRINYCNSLLYELLQIHLIKLQCVQNVAACLICNVSRFDHITPVLYQLHWLPVKFRIHFKVLLITFEALHGMSPFHIQELIKIKSKSRYCLGSNTELLLEPPNIITKPTLGDRAFVSAAPKLWNDLPSSICNEQSLESFKQSTKTYLFKKAFA